MIRTNTYLTEAQIQQLRAYAKRTGLKLAEVLRRVVDVGLQHLPRDTSRAPKEHDHAPP